MNEMTNSHILVRRFDYHRPGTLAEALALLRQLGPEARVLAGGTDLLVQMKMERTAPAAVVSVGQLPELKAVSTDGGTLRLGAGATIRSIEKVPAVRTHFQALAEACASFSSTQVATMGTLGGNLANASPASDSAPALIAFGAEIEIAGSDGVARRPLEQFFHGPGKSVLQPGELITAIVLPIPADGTGSAFVKIGRVTNDIAKASCAVTIVRQGDRVLECRMVFGSVAPTPFRARGAEAMLAGQEWSEKRIAAAARRASEEVSPIDDARSTAAYRRDIACTMAGDALRLAWERAKETRPAPAVANLAVAASPDTAGARAAAHVAAGERRPVSLKINGRQREVWVLPNDLLLSMLRDDLELTGTKYGCGIGECSACTVLMDGQPVLACLVLALEAAGHEITTIEGLAAPDGTLDPLQEAFIDHAAYQCGYCTPGMILTAKTLLNEKPQPEEDDVRHYLRGNMCRCTGYTSIVRAVLAAAEQSVARK